MEDRKRVVSQQSSPEQKRREAGAIYESLGDFLFDKINYISHPFSQITTNTGTTYDKIVAGTKSTSFTGISRLTDTAEGKFLKQGKKSRMRCHFYLSNPANILGYILSFVMFDGPGSLSLPSSMTILRSYAGLKIDAGVLYIVIKEANKSEKLIQTDIDLNTSGYTSTYVLEMRYSAGIVFIYIDNKLIGRYPYDMIGGYQQTYAYLPLFSPAKTYDGANYSNIIIENYQFIQDR